MASAASAPSTDFLRREPRDVTPAGQRFVKEYTEQVGRIPSFVENYCFITPYIIEAAIEKASVVDRKFREALSSLKMIAHVGRPVSSTRTVRARYIYMMEILSIKRKELHRQEGVLFGMGSRGWSGTDLVK